MTLLRRQRALGLAALGLLGLLVPLSLLTGAAGGGPFALLSDPEALWLLAVSRLPRTLAALLAGAGLAVAGVVMQLLVRNRFVEPATAGSDQAAGLGLVLMLIVFPGAGLAVKMAAATAAALLGTFGFLALVRRLPPHEVLLVPLTGIVYGGILGAATTFLAYERDLLQYINIWMAGEFSGVMLGRYEFLWLAGLAGLAAYLYADRFTIAGMGDEIATGLGLDRRGIVMLGLVLVSVVTAVTVVTVGMIPFVGLVVPNLVARLVGENLRHTLPAVALGGAGLVLACDIAARLIRYPYELPVGTILGALGAAVFLWLLYGRAAHAR